MDIGGIGRYFGETFGDINDLLEPLDPIIDFFTSPTPLIKDIPPLDALLKALSDTGEDTPLDLIDVLINLRGYDIDTGPIKAVLGAVQAISGFLDLAETGGINLGSFDFGNADLRNPLSATPDFAALAQGLASNIPALPDKIEQALANTSFGFSFPLLTDATSLVKLLLGSDFDLIKLDLPTVNLNVPFDLPSFGPIWPLPPVYIVITGSLGLQLNLDFGFDTTGLRAYQTSNNPVDILGGLYVVAPENVPIATFTAQVGAGALVGADVVIFKVGAEVTGGIQGDLKLFLDDPNNDGKFHISEFDEDSLDCMFELEKAKSVSMSNFRIKSSPDSDGIIDIPSGISSRMPDRFIQAISHVRSTRQEAIIIDFLRDSLGIDHSLSLRPDRTFSRGSRTPVTCSRNRCTRFGQEYRQDHRVPAGGISSRKRSRRAASSPLFRGSSCSNSRTMTAIPDNQKRSPCVGRIGSHGDLHPQHRGSRRS